MSRSDPLASVPVLHWRAGQTSVEVRSFANIAAKVAYLEQLAAGEQGARDPVVRALARRCVGAGGDPLEKAHAARAARVRYVAEDEEILESPRHVLERGFGDCEDHQVLGLALALAVGRRGRIVTMGGTPEEPEHASLIVGAEELADVPAWLPLAEIREAPRGKWSDTSVQRVRAGLPRPLVAHYGEHPYAAAMRVGSLDDADSAF